MRHIMYAVTIALMLGLAVAEVVDQSIDPLADRIATIDRVVEEATS